MKLLPRRMRPADGAAGSERTVLWAGLAAGLAVAGLAASVWRPLAPPTGAVVTALDDFPRDLLEAIAAYRQPRRVATVITLAVTLAVPLAAVATERGRLLVGRLAGAGGPRGGAAVAVGIVALADTATLPVDVAIGYVHEGRWGFRTSTLPGWSRDWVVAHAIEWLLVAAAGATVVWLVRRWPQSWPWRAAVAGTAAAAGLVLVGPVIVEAVWLDTRPLEPGPTREEVADVLARAGMGDVPILVGDASRRTTKVNAYVSGLGPSRQVVLYDNLLELPPDRVALVVAHEIAHRRHDDVLRGTLLTAAGLLPVAWIIALALRSPRLRFAAGARTPSDARLVAVAVAAATAAGLVSLPIGNVFSRRAERAADQAALELTQDPATAVRVFRTFVERDLADPAPPAWTQVLFGTHPTPGERIRRAVEFARAGGLPVPDADAGE